MLIREIRVIVVCCVSYMKGMHYVIEVRWILGRFRITALSFFMSVCTREATLLPLDGFE